MICSLRLKRLIISQPGERVRPSKPFVRNACIFVSHDMLYFINLVDVVLNLPITIQCIRGANV